MSLYLIESINAVLGVLALAILGRAVVGWVDPCGRTTAARVLFEITEPIQGPIRRVVPPIGGCLDISCWIAIVLIRLVSQALTQAATPI